MVIFGCIFITNIENFLVKECQYWAQLFLSILRSCLPNFKTITTKFNISTFYQIPKFGHILETIIDRIIAIFWTILIQMWPFSIEIMRIVTWSILYSFIQKYLVIFRAITGSQILFCKFLITWANFIQMWSF